MRRVALLTFLIGFFIPLLASAPAHAQATRTWVSGVGDDANPCSRTAPCKTFAGAISKTAASGEINCLDPGGFGAVTITKAITLNCSDVIGSVLVAGTPGITIAAGTGDIVVLRHIQLQGLGPNGTPGTIGVNITQAASVSIENCVITQFAQQGIKDVRTSGNNQLYVKDTIISFNGGAGMGIANSGGTLSAVVDGVRAYGNAIGIAAGPNNNLAIKLSTFAGSKGAGVEDDGGQISVDGSEITGNQTGVQNDTGTIRLSNNEISYNATGITGATTSFGLNRIVGNGSAGTAPTAAGASSAGLGTQ